jgi:hypothetical protein
MSCFRAFLCFSSEIDFCSSAILTAAQNEVSFSVSLVPRAIKNTPQSRLGRGNKARRLPRSSRAYASAANQTNDIESAIDVSCDMGSLSSWRSDLATYRAPSGAFESARASLPISLQGCEFVHDALCHFANYLAELFARYLAYRYQFLVRPITDLGRRSDRFFMTPLKSG